jgi:hypothetical protein
MSERDGSSTPGTGTAEIPVVRPSAGPPAEPPPAPAGPATETRATENLAAENRAAENRAAENRAAEPAQVPGMHPTAPVTARPAPRMPRRGPLTVMGPWAPVAGGILGLLLGVVVVLLLAGTAITFENRLALTFTVLGLGLLGTSSVLLADEVRMIRQRARDAVVRPAWIEATAGLLNGLTPARLLLLVSGFVLFLAAYVSR